MKDDNRLLLALDLGSITGFAVKSKHGLSHGTITFKKNKKWHDSGFRALYDWLNAFEDEMEIVVETPHGGYFNSSRILFGLLAIVHLFAELNEVPITWVSPKTVKKFATGKGNAKKPAMIAALQQYHPGVKEHNEVDALWILRHHLEQK